MTEGKRKEFKGKIGKYESHVKPYLEKITEMRREMTEEQIAESLGVGKTAWYKYKRERLELREALKKGEQSLVKDLKSALIMKAKGFKYTESKVVTKETSKGVETSTEVYEKYAQPDTGAIHLLLKNLDDSWRNDDKATMDIKQKQVELQEKKLEEEGW